MFNAILCVKWKWKRTAGNNSLLYYRLRFRDNKIVWVNKCIFLWLVHCTQGEISRTFEVNNILSLLGQVMERPECRPMYIKKIVNTSKVQGLLIVLKKSLDMSRTWVICKILVYLIH